MRSLRRAVLGVVLLATGCYQYIPGRPASVAPGTQVRVRVSPDYVDRLRLAEVLASTENVVAGRVTPETGDTLHLLVAVPAAGGPQMSGPRLNQRLALPPGSVLELEVRRVDRRRTALLVAAGAAFVGAVLWSQFTGWFGGDTLPGEPPKEFLPGR